MMRTSANPRLGTTSCEGAFAVTSAAPDNLGNMIANSVWTIVHVQAVEPKPSEPPLFVVVPDESTAPNLPSTE